MFGRKKKEKVYVELDPAEIKIYVAALMHFRNKCLRWGKPTEDINDLLQLAMKAHPNCRNQRYRKIS